MERDQPWRGQPWRDQPWRGQPWTGQPWRDQRWTVGQANGGQANLGEPNLGEFGEANFGQPRPEKANYGRNKMIEWFASCSTVAKVMKEARRREMMLQTVQEETRIRRCNVPPRVQRAIPPYLPNYTTVTSKTLHAPSPQSYANICFPSVSRCHPAGRPPNPARFSMSSQVKTSVAQA